jgi:hypothetical protein
MDHHLSIEESIRFGWQKTRAHSTLIFQTLLTLFGVQIAQQVVSRVLGGTLEGALASAALVVVSIVVGVGFTLITLRIAKGQHAAYQDLVPPVNVWVAYLAANIIAAIVSAVPLVAALVVCLVAYILLPAAGALAVTVVAAVAAVVAALYFTLRYAFVRFAILEDTEIIKSLRTSAHLSEGRKWWLLGFVVVVLLLNLLGAILLLVGLLVTIPVTMIAYAHVYITLHAHHASNQ